MTTAESTRKSCRRSEHATAPQPTDTEADQQKRRHPLDAFVPDPSDIPPLCDETEFAFELENMVADHAPRLFAVVQEYGDRVDARIAAWGIAFDDHAEVVSVERGLRMSLQAPENALRGFHFGSHIRARVVWFNPDAATPVKDDEAA
ncbi:hypothetical protein [Saccharomonospora sp.]|uniref:hypothetical protein n=1 Tax=Saccharomonospora sp. TaxID=33913 RepID=UPI0026394926|nr:hypothetical protein [Saccharomonospora sp.]